MASTSTTASNQPPTSGQVWRLSTRGRARAIPAHEDGELLQERAKPLDASRVLAAHVLVAQAPLHASSKRGRRNRNEDGTGLAVNAPRPHTAGGESAPRPLSGTRSGPQGPCLSCAPPPGLNRQRLDRLPVPRPLPSEVHLLLADRTSPGSGRLRTACSTS
eukprot:2198221-Rhodomonas_salina.4